MAASSLLSSADTHLCVHGSPVTCHAMSAAAPHVPTTTTTNTNTTTLLSLSASHLPSCTESVNSSTNSSTSVDRLTALKDAESSAAAVAGATTVKLASAVAAAATHVSLHPMPLASVHSLRRERNTITAISTSNNTTNSSSSTSGTTLAAVASAGLTCRDRLSTLYFCIFTRSFNRAILLLSLGLVCLSIYRPQCLLQSWYHVLEGLLTSFFVVQVGLRFALMRGKFFAAMFNVVEALACVMCVTLFALLHWNRRLSSLTVSEHRSLLLLRYVSQALRMMGIVALDAVSAEASGSHHSSSSSGGGGGCIEGIQVYAVGTDVVQPCASFVAARRRMNAHYEVV